MGPPPMYPVPIGPPEPTIFDKYWPAPAEPAGPIALGAVAAVALTAAALLTDPRPGLAWLLIGLVAALSLGLVARGKGLPPSRWVWAGAAVALLGVGTLRAAGWLFALCVLTALVCGSIALSGGLSARGLLCGGFTTAFAPARGVAWFARGTAAVQRRGDAGRWVRLVAAAGVGLALLLVFGGLFASADPAFAKLVDEVVPAIRIDEVFAAGFRFFIFGWGALGAAYLASRPPALDRLAAGVRRPVRAVEWMLPVVLLDLLFIGFVSVQLRAFFGGEQYVMRTAGLTYAEYARRGFWQLAAVTVLTLAVIAMAARKAPRESSGDRLGLRVVLGALTVLALVVVASALIRMAAYEQAYGLTRLRLLVAACEIWLGLVFGYVLAAGARLQSSGTWLARAVIGTGVGMLLAIAVLNPDRLIAERNIDRFDRGGQLDLQYLGGLSADAVPALDRLPAWERSCALSPIVTTMERDAWYQFNWGRWQAHQAAPPAVDVGRECWSGRP
jgi:hypothetical protein